MKELVRTVKAEEFDIVFRQNLEVPGYGGEWKQTTLGFLLLFANGKTSPDRAVGMPYPVYGSNDIIGYTRETNTDEETIIIGRVGSYCGSLYLSRGRCWVTDNAIRANAINDNDPRFLYYLLGSLNLNHWRGGSGQPLLNQMILNSISVSTPSPKLQRRIAHILGTLDDKIELNRRINRTLEKMAAAIFKSWFIDFDPVRAKADGRDTGLPEEIADLFPDSFEDSEIGEIPKGWKVGPLTEIATLQTKTVQPSKRPDTLWEHYSIPAFDEGRQPKWERGDTIKSGKYAVPRNSVLASKLNPQFPRIWLPEITDSDVAICSTEFMPFVPTQYTWRPYLYELIKSSTVQDEICSRASGSTGSRQRVKPQEVAEIPVVIPQPKVVDAFWDIVAGLHAKLLANRRNSLLLARTRDTLIPKLLSGEMEVSDAVKVLEDAV